MIASYRFLGTALNQSDSMNATLPTFKRDALRRASATAAAETSAPSTAESGRSLAGDGERDRAGPAAESENLGALVGVDAHQRKLDQKLGLRPRDQYVGRHFE